MAAPRGAATSSLTIENAEKLTDIHDIEKVYELVCTEEALVNDELDELLHQKSSLESQMVSLHKSLPNLQLVHNDSTQLTSMITFTSTLAENVSGKVRQLDLAKSRVVSCKQRVDDVLDVKFCTDGVQKALQDEDYEQAAAHIHRFLSLDENLLRMSADASEGSTLDTSFKLLHEAQSKLKNIVHNKFDAAVHQGDVASVERFFKIFPLIGEHEEGLNKFSKYICAQLTENADKNLQLALLGDAGDKRASVLYADTFTLLFEGVARAVEIHQALVETKYGFGNMFIVMEHIQKACDRQSRKIMEEFKKDRQFNRKVQQVQQNLMNQKPSSMDKMNPKDLDVLLAEITLINTRAELYLRFIRRRLHQDVEVAVQNDESKEEKLKEVDKFVNNCELNRLMQELIGNYIMMEEFFMREMVIKAVSMDITESGALTSSMVDDTFFIIKKSVRRAMSSSSVDGVCAMLNHACTLLEHDYREILFSRLRQGFPSGFDITQAYNFVQSSIQQGKLATSDEETQKAKSAFLITLNDTEVSCDYIQKLKKNIEDETSKLFYQANEQSKAKLQSGLGDLGSASSRFKDVLDFGFTQLNSSVVKPRVKPWIDSFLAVSHNITEDDFSNFEANDPWVQIVIVNLDGLLATFKVALTSTNYDMLVASISTEMTTQLEKAVFKTSYNRLGGLQFDKELRSLVGYLSSVATWTIRDRFARLTQMATILNLERVAEILDYWGANAGSLTWRLTPAEVRQVLSLRVDFRTEDIKRLKL